MSITGHPLIVVVAPACPACHSADLRVYKTLATEPDGTIRRYTQCRRCCCKFVVASVPPRGKGDGRGVRDATVTCDVTR